MVAYNRFGYIMAYRVKDRISYDFFNPEPAGSFDISYQAFQTVSFIRDYNWNKVCSCFDSFLYQFRIKCIDTYRSAGEGFCKGYCFPDLSRKGVKCSAQVDNICSPGEKLRFLSPGPQGPFPLLLRSLPLLSCVNSLLYLPQRG